jgi:hypothetical protein
MLLYTICSMTSLLYRTINNKTDSDLLQRDLTTLEDWENKWQMSFNAKKCIVIRIALKNKQVRQTSYKLHGHTLDNVEALSVLLLMVRYRRLSSANNLISYEVVVL